jgi:hypothetical protein
MDIGSYFDLDRGMTLMPYHDRNLWCARRLIAMVESGQVESVKLPSGCHLFDPAKLAGQLGALGHKSIREFRPEWRPPEDIPRPAMSAAEAIRRAMLVMTPEERAKMVGPTAGNTNPLRPLSTSPRN